MIKPYFVGPNPLNVADKLQYECKQCGAKGIMEVSSFDTDDEGNALQPIEENCPECGEVL